MRFSRYNWAIPYNGCYLLYNGLTGSLLHCFESSYFDLAQSIDSENSDAISSLSDDDISLLLREGFVVHDDFNELAYLNSLSLGIRYDPRISYITAVCTLECNFQCSYCFQSNLHREVQPCMDANTIDKIACIVADSTANEMSLCLFGGEPLLVPDTCLRLCIAADHAASISNKSLCVTLVTNGYLLDQSLLDELAHAGVKKVQITIDGDEQIHNRRRRLKGGGDTFQRILENANRASHQLETIIRVNIDEGYSYHLDSLKAALDPRISIVFSATKYDHCGNPDQTRKNVSVLESILRKEKLNNIDYIGTRYGGCIAVNRSAITVLPDGKIVKCWDELEKDCTDVSLSIHNDGHMAIRPYHKWYSWNPYDGSIEECSNCRMLPNCGGGCPNQYLAYGKPTCYVSETTLRQQVVELFETKMGTSTNGG